MSVMAHRRSAFGCGCGTATAVQLGGLLHSHFCDGAAIVGGNGGGGGMGCFGVVSSVPDELDLGLPGRPSRVELGQLGRDRLVCRGELLAVWTGAVVAVFFAVVVGGEGSAASRLRTQKTLEASVAAALLC